MRYYKLVSNGLLDAIGTGNGGTEITETEYNVLMALIINKPTAPDGYEYRITEAGEYVLAEAPNAEPPEEDDELTDEEALDIILGGGGGA